MAARASVGFARKRGANPRRVVTRTDIEGYRAGEYADLPRFRQLMVVRGSYGRSTRIPQPQSALAVARSGEVYVTVGTEYELLALNADTTARWALQVAWERMEVADERIDQPLRHVMGLGEDNDIPSRSLRDLVVEKCMSTLIDKPVKARHSAGKIHVEMESGIEIAFPVKGNPRLEGRPVAPCASPRIPLPLVRNGVRRGGVVRNVVLDLRFKPPVAAAPRDRNRQAQ